jgi:hypothetical protein
MPDSRRAKCTCCGGHRDDVGEMSWTGLCITCGVELLAENATGIRNKSGPAHRRRLRGMARYLERAMLDERQLAP